jgi:hypothetical protein
MARLRGGPPLRYRVEFLTETTQEESVCSTLAAGHDLTTAEWCARVRGAEARLRFNAGGFQIRDLEDKGRIVALESFDDPIRRFENGVYTVH